MTAGPLLSVRGTARRTLTPDEGVLNGVIRTTGSSKADALAAAGVTQRAVVAALAAIGGVTGAAGERVPLSWLTRQAATWPEEEYDNKRQKSIVTGRTVALVRVEIRIRDLELLDAVGEALESIEDFSQYNASWVIDDDNPEWRRVRAEAIRDALRQADDYAAALECRVARVEQVADAGLLSDVPMAAPAAARMFRAGGGAFDASASGGGPNLDPVPQEISATIDVRCATEQLTS